MRYFLIMNPSSKGGKSRKLFNRIFEALDNRKIEYSYEITNSPDRAYELSKLAGMQNFDVIVAVGGDGTINRVLNGLFDSSGKRISKSRFGVIYTGTSPDFCKSYGIPISLDGAINTLINMHEKEIQIGKIVFSKSDHKGYDQKTEQMTEKTTQYFACCANIGIGAQVARIANSGIRKYLGDYGGTFIALIRSLISYRPASFKVSIDGVAHRFDRVCNIFIGKTYYVASGLKVRNELECLDDRFYCLVVQNINLINLFGILNAIYTGKQIKNSKAAKLLYGKNIEISGMSEIEFDGDPAGFLPCSIEMATDTIRLILICKR